MTDENYLRQFKKRRRTLADWLLRRAQAEEKSAQRFWQTFDALDVEDIDESRCRFFSDDCESVERMVTAIDGYEATMREKLNNAYMRIYRHVKDPELVNHIHNILKLMIAFGGDERRSVQCLAIKLATKTNAERAAFIRKLGRICAKSSGSKNNKARSI